MMSSPNNDDSRLQPCTHATLRAYLELMRLPNVFTAMADVAMGYLFIQQADWRFDLWRDSWTLGLLLATSSLLYIAGMVLNDVFDRTIDRHERPERPIPSGRVSVAAARRSGFALLVLGVVFASNAAVERGQWRPAGVALLLAGAILLYDAWLKRTPLGPPAMGACRMLNVFLGMSAVAVPLTAAHWLVARGIGVYIVGVTWFARNEATASRRVPLALATLVMLAGIGMLAWFPRWSAHVVPLLQREPQRWYMLTGALGLLIGWRCLRAIAEPTRERVQMAVVHGLLSLVVFDAVACYAVRGVFWASMILLLLAPTMLLGRRVRMT